MNESQSKRRGWIKNIVIIFLVVLLILTLFSNTILNYSLPEVAVQYPQYATIASRIRQTASVEANQSYSVSIEQTRVISSVEVRVGQTIQKGDVLFRLEEGDSSELAEANRTLQDLNIQLIQKLKADPSLSGSSSSSMDDAISALKKSLSTAQDTLTEARATLADEEEKLAELQAQQEALPGYDQILSAKNLVAQIDANLEYLTEEIERLQGKQGQIGGDGYYTPAEIEELIADAEYKVQELNVTFGWALRDYDKAAVRQKSLEESVKTATKALEGATEAVEAYQSQMSSGGSSSMDALMKEMQSLQTLQNELSALKSELSVFIGGASYRSAVSAAQSAVSSISSQVSALQSKISYAENQLADYRPQLSQVPSLETVIKQLEADKAQYEAELSTLEASLTEAQAQLSTAESNLNQYYLGNGYYSMTYSSESAYNQAIEQKQASYNSAQQTYQKNYYTYIQSSQENSTLTNLKAVETQAKLELEELTEQLTAAKTDTETKKKAFEEAQIALDDAEAELEKVTGYREYDSLGDDVKTLQKQVTEMETQRIEAQTLIDSASDASVKALETEIRAQNTVVTLQKRSVTEAQKDVTELQADIAEAEAKAEKQAKQEEEAAKLDNKQYQIELAQIRDKIRAQQDLILRLEENQTDGTVVSPVSGIIASLSVAAGQEAEANTPIASITLSDMGYTMKCTVTSEQAAKINVGDAATIQWYYWGETPTARVVSIKADAASQGQNKIITLEVTGDVTPGTSLTFTLGDKNTSYDCVVPNSAVREDSGGKFVLVVTAKDTPLGNRYSARRVDVEVLASDDTNSAVSGSISGEYVITTSSTPISAGMQVRLSENN